ncbi:hypothetical protein Poli38472_001036 [Pythium oligandrum]|uniref:Uncharacterized protein n=1 Tax=Pythium oligandrum TaxID=41045 RepID=A0A8K1FM23_PYTOL|nr:hypothetical protein Poli38472_001036 [Pythium oligandrum]|eukprot:TMW68880.1 hypothetical protein Poli38472_001036 [Pythium oligandrum]
MPRHGTKTAPSTADINLKRMSRRLSGRLDDFVRQQIEKGRTVQVLWVEVSPWGHRSFWMMILLLRTSCSVFLGVTARTYWFIAHPYMSYYANLLGPTVFSRFKPIGVCYALVGLAHVYQAIKMGWYSLRYRAFVFEARPTDLTDPDDVQPLETLHSGHMMQWHSKFNVGNVFQCVRGHFFGRHDIFGVDSSYFQARFVMREMIEIVSQSTQVYKSSVLIAKVWINNLFVALTVINCWSTPIIQYFSRHSPALERLTCLFVDFVLDASSSVVIAIIIFLPYYQIFNFETYNFEISYLYDDVWFANMVTENPQLFALTKWDFVWKIIPHLSMYSCLSSIHTLVRPRVCAKRENRVSLKKRSSVRVVPNLPNDVARKSDVMPTLAEFTSTQLPTNEDARAKLHYKLLHIALGLWGLAVLVLHVIAVRTSLSADVPYCKQPVRPWFTTKFSCAVIQFNCHRNNSTGVTNEDLEILQADNLVAVVFSHCSELRVPTRIRSFRNLLGIDIYNSTLFEWSAEAAITNETHPSLTYIIFVRVNMTQLPDGVLQTLPSTMTDFEVSVTNLTELPADLHKRWHPMSLAYFEHTDFKEFPPTLIHLPIDDLSLIGSDIETLPEFPADHPGFFTLTMTHTPLKALPDSFGDTRSIGFLSLGYTQLTQFPSWMQRVARTASKVYVHHTPFCEGLSTEAREKEYGENAVLTCFAKDDRVNGKYPLAMMAPRRLL